jgi:mRNA-degrading endonuclease RelE of RelBE toxin-antitoxin system
MDKIQKALKKLTIAERKQVKIILQQLLGSNFRNLDIKKLKGRKDIYRVRKGQLRIIFRIDRGKNIFILSIERRNDKTYQF